MLTFDSLAKPIGGEMARYIIFQKDTIAGEFSLSLTCDSGGTVLPGVHFLGDLCATAQASAIGTTTIQSISPPERFYLEGIDGGNTAPVLVAGDIEISEPLATGGGENSRLPQFRLEQNRPNPFNANTSVRFELPKAGSARLTVYNVLGQEVTVLVEGFLSAGIREAVWNGKDDTGREMAAGIYFYKLSIPDREAVRKMIYLK